MKHKLIKE
jgi:hypothetical protein